MNKVVVRFWIRKKSIYTYIIVNTEKCTAFSTGVRILNEIEWNPKTQTVACETDQLILNEIKSKIRLLALELDRSQKPYNAEILKSYFLTKTKPPELFTDVFEKLIEHKAKQEKEKRTVQTYRTRLNILTRYLTETKQLKITIPEINIQWIKVYKQWLNLKYPYQKSDYANKALQAMYSVMKHGHRLCYISNNPLEYIEYFPRKTKPKIYLTLEELEALERFKYSQSALERVKDLFLWQCYTGMDYSTMSEFKTEFVRQHQKGMYIDGRRIKTDTRYVLPFFPKALEIWNKYGGSLPIISNQKYNSY